MSEETDWRSQQHLLADLLKEKGYIETTAVFDAFCTIPRHYFLPNAPLDLIYSDRVIATKFDNDESISSSSQPGMMAIMLEQLALQPGDNVLEIGAGTGFNAALMSHLVGPHGHVTTIDLDDDLVADAQAHLATAQITNVTVLRGDGSDGYATNAPYDRIILTVGSWDIFPAWWAQLGENGRLLLPLSLNGPQVSVAFKRQQQQLHSLSVTGCGFMRQRGSHAEPLIQQPLGDKPGLSLHYTARPHAPHPATVWQWLQQPPTTLPLPSNLSTHTIWNGFRLWLALSTENSCLLEAHNLPDSGLPALLQSEQGQAWQLTTGLLDEQGLALVVRISTAPNSHLVLGFGPEQTAVAHQLHTHLTQWLAAGCPSHNQLHITALPSAAPIPDGDFKVLKRPFSTFLCHWGTEE